MDSLILESYIEISLKTIRRFDHSERSVTSAKCVVSPLFFTVIEVRIKGNNNKRNILSNCSIKLFIDNFNSEDIIIRRCDSNYNFEDNYRYIDYHHSVVNTFCELELTDLLLQDGSSVQYFVIDSTSPLHNSFEIFNDDASGSQKPILNFSFESYDTIKFINSSNSRFIKASLKENNFSVNVQTGLNKYTYSLFNFENINKSFSLGLVYNYKNPTSTTFSGLTTGLPKGFKTNFHQRIDLVDGKLIYFNEDGESCEYIQSLNNSNVYFDKSGTRNIIKNDELGNYHLIDTNFNDLEFSCDGRLSCIHFRKYDEYYDLFIEYENNSSKIIRIYDNDTINIQFLYSNIVRINFNGLKNNVILTKDSDGFLSTIREVGKYITNLSYDYFFFSPANIKYLYSFSVLQKKCSLEFDTFLRVKKIIKSSDNNDIDVEYEFENSWYEVFLKEKKMGLASLQTNKIFLFNEKNECFNEYYLDDNRVTSPKVSLINKDKNISFSKAQPIETINNILVNDDSLHIDFIEGDFTENNDYVLYFEVNIAKEQYRIHELGNISIELYDGNYLIGSLEIDEAFLSNKTLVNVINFKPRENHPDSSETNPIELRVRRINSNKNIIISNIRIFDYSTMLIDRKMLNVNAGHYSVEDVEREYIYAIENNITVRFEYNLADMEFAEDIYFEDLLYSFLFHKFFNEQVLFCENGKKLYFGINNLRFRTLTSSSNEDWINLSDLKLYRLNRVDYSNGLFVESYEKISGSNNRIFYEKFDVNKYNQDSEALVRFKKTISSPSGKELETINSNGYDEYIFYDRYNYIERIAAKRDGKFLINDFINDERGNTISGILYLTNHPITNFSEFDSFNRLISTKTNNLIETQYQYDLGGELIQVGFENNHNEIEYNYSPVESTIIRDDRTNLINEPILGIFDSGCDEIQRIEFYNQLYYLTDRICGTNFYKELHSYHHYEFECLYDKYGRLIEKNFNNGDFIHYIYNLNDAFGADSDAKLQKIIYTSGQTFIQEIYHYDKSNNVKEIINGDNSVEIERAVVKGSNTFFNSIRKKYYNANFSNENPWLVEFILNCTLTESNKEQSSIVVEISNDVVSNRTLIEQSITDRKTDGFYETFKVNIVGFPISIKYEKEKFYKRENVTGDSNYTNFISEEILYKSTQGPIILEPIYSIQYSYNLNGQISNISYLNKSSSFQYDYKNQLIQEISCFGTIEYTYDNYGNILTKSINGLTVNNCVYNSKNQLIQINNFVNSYDEFGFPIEYKGQSVEFDFGGLLIRYGDTRFEYDVFRRLTRINKNGFISTEIDYFDNRIFKITRYFNSGPEVFFPIYGVGNSIVGFLYNSAFYHIERNALGDVIAIFDESQNMVASYFYDAFGNYKVYDGNNNLNSDPLFIGNSFPFKFKGYYYVAETSLYYITSRYYDPEIGRFISPDSVDYLDPSTINGLNLYAYCGNDPVNRVDPTGHDWNWTTFWTGVWLVVTAAGAIAASIATFGLATPIAMSVVAGVTLGAGVLTGINGVATLIEAGTDYNFVRDGAFNGLGLSDEAYNIYAGVTEGVAIVGTAICTIWNITNPIKGFTKHGMDSALTHDGHGVSAKAMQNAVRHPLDVVNQANGGIKHVGKNAVVVLNESGKVITTYPLNKLGWRFWISLW